MEGKDKEDDHKARLPSLDAQEIPSVCLDYCFRHSAWLLTKDLIKRCHGLFAKPRHRCSGTHNAQAGQERCVHFLGTAVEVWADAKLPGLSLFTHEDP